VSAFVLIPGAGGVAWYWHLVTPLLQAAGHEAVAVDLPGDDPKAGLPEYTDLVLKAIGGRRDVVLVAQSLGGFTAPLVAERASLRSLILVNAMVPVPGETPGAWWDATGAIQARVEAADAGGYTRDFDEAVYFLHDVPPSVVRAGAPHQHPESDAVFGSICDFTAWPSVPTRVIVGADDRFFPAAFQREVARQRLGLTVEILPGGHLMALSRPHDLANALLAPSP
jgi:pimeloyl-ACP methyl ester carboxylesterase